MKKTLANVNTFMVVLSTPAASRKGHGEKRGDDAEAAASRRCRPPGRSNRIDEQMDRTLPSKRAIPTKAARLAAIEDVIPPRDRDRVTRRFPASARATRDRLEIYPAGNRARSGGGSAAAANALSAMA